MSNAIAQPPVAAQALSGVGDDPLRIIPELVAKSAHKQAKGHTLNVFMLNKNKMHAQVCSEWKSRNGIPAVIINSDATRVPSQVPHEVNEVIWATVHKFYADTVNTAVNRDDAVVKVVAKRNNSKGCYEKKNIVTTTDTMYLNEQLLHCHLDQNKAKKSLEKARNEYAVERIARLEQSLLELNNIEAIILNAQLNEHKRLEEENK